MNPVEKLFTNNSFMDFVCEPSKADGSAIVSIGFATFFKDRSNDYFQEEPAHS